MTYFQQINDISNQDSTPDSLSSSLSHSNSYSSLPELVPITNEDLIDGVPDLFTVHNTFDLESLNTLLDTSSNTFDITPPDYSFTDTQPPGYQPQWAEAVILRRIRILQREATELYRVVDQRREENIALYNAAVNSQLRDHDTRYQQNIEHLEDLLNIWS